MTLTGLYNVLEALKEGRELNPKEKAIYTQGRARRKEDAWRS